MLLDFRFSNWKSFKEETSLSAYSTSELQHGHRRAIVKKYKKSGKILPIIAIFGGNASGKSNLIDAIKFVKEYVLNGVGINERINISNFALDPKYKNIPTSFCVEMLIDEIKYKYSFSLLQNKVVEEKLLMENSNSIYELFYRNYDKYTFDSPKTENEGIKFAAKGTQPNKLFLTNTIEQKIENFRNVYDWFKKILIVTPDTKITLTNIDPNEIMNVTERYFSCLDTGVVKVKLSKVDLGFFNLPTEMIEDIKNNLTEESPYAEVTNLHDNYSFRVHLENDELVGYKYEAVHNTRDGEKTFDLSFESDGTRRVLDLIPVFHELNTSDDKILIIDEIDRSLHTQLTRILIESFLDEVNSETRKQLIVTTHDIFLMDQDILRRDEMYLTERNNFSESEIFSISDFEEIRADSDIRKLYFNGRFGGNPKLCSIF